MRKYVGVTESRHYNEMHVETAVFSVAACCTVWYMCVGQAFIGPDITFAMKPYFRGSFCSEDVREGLVVAFVRHILSVSQVCKQ